MESGSRSHVKHNLRPAVTQTPNSQTITPPGRLAGVGGYLGSYRDTKDLRFGMGLGTIHVNSPERRDRLWLINAFAVVLLTLLGAAGEALGYDRMLKTSTVKRRVHSLFRQGCLLYVLLPTMRDDWLSPLIQRFSQMLQEQPLFADVFGPV